MMTPTARSTMLPRLMNSRNSVAKEDLWSFSASFLSLVIGFFRSGFSSCLLMGLLYFIVWDVARVSFMRGLK